MSDNVYVRSMGLVPVGEHWEKSLLDLAVDAALGALDGAGWPAVDAVLVSNMLSERLLSQSQLGALVAARVGLRGTRSMRVEAAQASGGVAVSLASSLVRSGAFRNVLVIGVEKTRDSLAEDAIEALSSSEDSEYALMSGADMYTFAAMMTNLYMSRYGVEYEDLAAFPVIAHENAAKAAHAQFRRPLTVKQVLESPVVSDPVRVMDSPPLSDGAAAVLLSSEDGTAEVAFSDYSVDDVDPFKPDEPSLPALRELAGRAEKQGIDMDDADFVELHDSFSVLAALALEELGYAARGEAARDAARGRFRLEGELPISTFGGMKARGFPAGASGVYQVCEAALQVSGRAERNQVKDAEVGVTVNIGGFGGTAALTVLRRR